MMSRGIRPAGSTSGKPYVRKVVPSKDLLAGVTVPQSKKWGFQFDASNVVYAGISIDPTSGFQDLTAYFDDDDTPVALTGGVPVRRQFTKVRLTPLYPWSFTTALVQLGPTFAWAGKPGVAIPQLNPQSAAVRLWFEEPFAQPLAPLLGWSLGTWTGTDNIPAGAHGGTAVAHFHLPACKQITLAVSLFGATNSGPLRFTLHRWRSEGQAANITDGQDPLSQIGATSATLGDAAALATVLLPATDVPNISGAQFYEDSASDPGGGEYLVQLDATAFPPAVALQFNVALRAAPYRNSK